MIRAASALWPGARRALLTGCNRTATVMTALGSTTPNAAVAQSVMRAAYPIEQRWQAMGIWGVGIMLGPIMGPTLGGFLTENYSWHWVFLVNLPVGVLTVFGLLVFMDETRRHEHLRFDWFAFLALAAGIGGMQLMLDRGEQLGWFGSPEIVAEL